MNKIQYILNKLMEEASEVTKVASKASRFGLNESHPDLQETNIERLDEEIKDFLVAYALLLSAADHEPSELDEEDVMKRIDKFMQYTKYSVNCGQLSVKVGNEVRAVCLQCKEGFKEEFKE